MLISSNENNIQNTRNFLSDQISSELKLYSNVISSAAVALESNDLSNKEIHSYLNNIVFYNPVFSTIYVSTANNQNIISGQADLINNDDLTSRPWYAETMKNIDTLYSEVYTDDITEQLIITISTPIFDDENKVSGVIAGDILINQMIAYVKNAHVDHFGYAFLIDGRGNIIAHPETYGIEPKLQKINDLQEGLFSQMIAEGNGKKEVTFNDEEGYLSFQSIKDTGWTIAVFANIYEHNKLNTYLWSMFFIGVFVTLIVFLLFYYMQNKYFLRPLNMLVNDINHIDIENDTSYRIPLNKKEPFLTLSHSINFVLNKFEQLFKEQQTYQKDLSESNQELATSNKNLTEMKQTLEEQYETLKKRESELYHLSYYDQTTGLYNRRFFHEQLNKLDTEEYFPLGFIMGDVNGLKLINDSFGHQIGDQLLMKTGELMQRFCTKEQYICRIGGDEFAIIAPNTNEEELKNIISNIKAHSNEHGLENINLSISFGFSIKHEETEDILVIMKQAEDYMYSNKLLEGPSIRHKTIDTIIQTLHEKNPHAKNHSTRVAELSKKMGYELNMTEDQINLLETIGLLHDIGKIAISNRILEKSGPLTAEEWREMKRHPEIGYRILSTINEIAQIAEYVLYHHERYDGTGYPRGLSGENIPLFSRIITIVDAYDAMTSDRPYRKKLTEEEAINQLVQNAGKQFDTDLAKLFVEKVLNKKWTKK